MMKDLRNRSNTGCKATRRCRLRKLLSCFLALSVSATMLGGNASVLFADEPATEYALAGALSGQDVTVHFGEDEDKDINIHVNPETGVKIPDGAGEVEAETEAETETESQVVSSKRVYTYEDDKVLVTATLEKADAVPSDAVLRVTPVTKDSDGYNYDAYMKALNENADKVGAEQVTDASSLPEAKKINEAQPTQTYDESNTLLYDIAFIVPDYDGNGDPVEGSGIEYEPAEGTVQISIEFKKKQLSREISASSDNDVSIVHFPVSNKAKEGLPTTADIIDITSNDISVENVQSNISVGDKDKVEFKVDSFSVYGAVCNSASSSGAIKVKMIFKDASGNVVDPGLGNTNLYMYIENRSADYTYIDGYTKAEVSVKANPEHKRFIKLVKDNNNEYTGTVEYLYHRNDGESNQYPIQTSTDKNYYLTLFSFEGAYENDNERAQVDLVNPNGKTFIIGGTKFKDEYLVEYPDGFVCTHNSYQVQPGYEYTIVAAVESAEAIDEQLGKPGGDTFASVLGDAVNYGVVTEYFYLNTGDAQTNVAAYKGRCETQTGNDMTNDVEQTFILAEIDNVFKIKGYKAYVMVPLEEAGKVEENGINNGEHITVDTSQSKAQLLAEVKAMLDFTRAQSLHLMSKDDNCEIEVRNGKYVVDLSSRASGTYYVNVSDDMYASIMGEAEALKIIKSNDQTIVFNIAKSGSLDMMKFSIATDNTDGTRKGSDEYLVTTESVPQTIIWNMPNAENINIKGSITGTVLAHNAEVFVDATSSGWLVAKKVRIGSGEWHNVYQHVEKISGSATLRAIKTISNEEAAKSGFTFGLEYKNPDGSWQSDGTAINGNSAITFAGSESHSSLIFDDNNFVARKAGTDRHGHEYAYYYYRIKETNGTTDSQGNQYDIDSSIYYVKVKVTKVQVKKATTTTIYSYRASEPEYYRDEACTDRIDQNTLPTFNNTPQGKKNVHVVKKWKGGIADGLTSIKVRLFRLDGNNYVGAGKEDLTLNAGNGWSGDFDQLDATDSAGNPVTYSVAELDKDNNPIRDGSQIAFSSGAQYKVDISEYPAGTFTITNSRPEKITLKVEKKWTDGVNNPLTDTVSIPEINVNIYRVKARKDGTGTPEAALVSNSPITLNSDNSWVYTSPSQVDTEVEENGVTYTYSYYVEEIPVTGFEVGYSPFVPLEIEVGGQTKVLYQVGEDGKITITNKQELTDIPVFKQWKDDDNTNGHRPETIKLQLIDKDNENVVIKEAEISTSIGKSDVTDESMANIWNHTFYDLPKYKYDSEEQKWVRIQYAVREVMDDETVKYYSQTKNEVNKDSAGNITGIELVNTESSSYALPATGGEGTRWIYLTSIMLIALAGYGLVIIRRRRV